MRKKISSVIMAGVLSVSAFASLASCGEVVEGGAPEGRTEIKISLYTGGYGNVWLTNLMNDLNNSQETYWYTKLADNKYSGEDITQRILGGIVEGDVYFSSAGIDQLIAQDCLMDLTEIYESTAPNETKKIKDRAPLYENYKVWFGKGDGVYAMPQEQGISGIIYDCDLFETMGWFRTDTSTASGLTKGTDGVEGTYDDGLPETYEQFKELLAKIRQAQMIPFIQTDMLGFDQMEFTAEAIWAQYDGYENYKTGVTYSGTYTSPSNPNKVVKVTPETGYKVYTENCMEGREKAMQFLTEVFNNPANMYQGTGISHTDAQAIWLTSHNMQNPIAMLLDGDWWENEARRAFVEDSNVNGEDYAYGNRTFRLMPVTAFEGQDESSNGKHFFARKMVNVVYAVKQADETKKQGVMEFLRAFASEKNCVNYTSCNGGRLAYDYTISDEVKATLTPFSRNIFEIFEDENTTIVNPDLLEKESPFINPPDRWRNMTIAGTAYNNPLSAFKDGNVTVAQYMQSVGAAYDAESWAKVK